LKEALTILKLEQGLLITWNHEEKIFLEGRLRVDFVPAHRWLMEGE
jgi:hypothetical protein